jgi:hypothetical protein
MKNTEYEFIQAEDPEELNGRVNAHLSDGWSLYGNPMVWPIENGNTAYGQAMIRNVEWARPLPVDDACTTYQHLYK